MKRSLLALAMLLAGATTAVPQVQQVGPDGPVNPRVARPVFNHSDLTAFWRDLRAARTMEEVREPATRFGLLPWRFRGAVKLPRSDVYTDVSVSILNVRRSVEGVILGDEAVLVDWEIEDPVGLAGRRVTVIRPGEGR